MMIEKKDAAWIRRKLCDGVTLIGTHVFAGSPMLTELLSSMNFDIIWVDGEHTPFDNMTIFNNVVAVRAGGAACLVRIPEVNPTLAKPILDMGPDILLFPNIHTYEEALLAVKACEYPPKGIRGYGPQRAYMFGECSQMEYITSRYRNMLRAVQIEQITCVNDLDRIADIEGIDLFIVGPNDLTGSMGKMAQFDDPEVMKVFDLIGTIMARHKRSFGVSIGFDPIALRQWKERGAQVLFSGFDCGYVRDGAQLVYDGLSSLK